MDDKELLELAAKAAGLKVIYNAGDRGLWLPEEDDEWNPLTDNGDALLLAVKLRLVVDCGYDMGVKVFHRDKGVLSVCNWDSKNEMEVVRRAIVRAAAEIGTVTK